MNEALLSDPGLYCPLNGQRLRLATPEELEAFNASGKRVCNAAAPQFDLAGPLEALLIREDGAIAYGVVEGIPVLLPDHGFALRS